MIKISRLTDRPHDISTKSYQWQWKCGCSLTSCPGRSTVMHSIETQWRPVYLGNCCPLSSTKSYSFGWILALCKSFFFFFLFIFTKLSWVSWHNAILVLSYIFVLYPAFGCQTNKMRVNISYSVGKKFAQLSWKRAKIFSFKSVQLFLKRHNCCISLKLPAHWWFHNLSCFIWITLPPCCT